MFKTIFTQLCNEKNQSPAYVCEQLGLSNSVYSKWTDTSLPRRATLMKIAQYFNVTVEYLAGEGDGEALAATAMGEVVEWLEDNEYEVQEDESGTYTISKGGKSVYYSNGDFVTESLRIKAIATEGFELAMCEWERKHFSVRCELTEQEETLLRLFRGTTEEGRFEMIAAFMEIKKDIEKKNTGTDTRSVG